MGKGTAMNGKNQPVVLYFAFANDHAGPGRYLRNLDQECSRVDQALEMARQAGHCEVFVESDATLDEVLDFLQDPEYRDRAALFHFGGHAGDAELLLETAGAPPKWLTPEASRPSWANSAASSLCS